MTQINVANCYKIHSVLDLKMILQKNIKTWRNFDEQLSTNNALIYFLSTDEVILIPSHVLDDDLGILFDSKECYKAYLEKDDFPIENPDKSIHEQYKHEVENIQNKVHNILTYLKRLSNSDSLTDLQNIIQLAELLENVRAVKSKLSAKDRLYAALGLGEYLRRVNNGEWLLLKFYGKYNPYYEPAILYPNGKFLLVLNHAHSYFDNDKLSLEKYSNWEEIKDPVNSKENTFAFEYKIL
jgi:hypothetical protein